MPGGPNPPAGRLASGLHIGSQNMRSMRTYGRRQLGKLHSALQLWIHLRWDVVFVQETHLSDSQQSSGTEASLQASATLLHHPGYTAYWAHAPPGGYAGVGILLHSGRLASGELQAANPQAHGDDGRLLSIQLTWRGHAITAVCAYLPSSNPGQQRQFITARLRPLFDRSPAPVLLAGDFNFTEDFHRDRGCVGVKGGSKAMYMPASEHGPGGSRTSTEEASCQHPTRLNSSVPSVHPSPAPLALSVLDPPDPAPPPTHSHSAPAPLPAADTQPAPLGANHLHPAITACPTQPYQQPPSVCLSAPSPSWHHDVSVAAVMREQCPQLVCAFRARHPSKRAFTYISPNGASRIDRIYVSQQLLPYVEQCNVGLETVSDHRPVLLHLRPAAPSAIGPGMRRLRMHFSEVASLHTAFADWLQRRLSSAPLHDDQLLLAWWHPFKHDVALMAASLNKQATSVRRAVSSEYEVAKDAYASAVRQVDSGDPSALPVATAARGAYVHALLRQSTPAAVRVRCEWLHTGERPCPLVSKLTMPPRTSRLIACMRGPNGGLVTGSQIPSHVAHFFARISAAPPANASAQEQVLAALRASGIRMPADVAARIGAPSITAEECVQALRKVPAGLSPGPDGIPSELYRTYRSQLSPVLAAVMSAIGRLGQTPIDFLDGVLVALFKKGDIADAANYRPITLLNTDYRLLAKVLAARLGPALQSLIGPEQSAFLPGRSIGENIMFLQLLPPLLRAEQRSAVIAFLDFSKAYDTVNRDFMFAVMETMGVGPGLLQWARVLLSDTKFVAVVNGFVSRPVQSHAGVRQGCPLSPFLYLFVAQALNCWLRASGFGIPVSGRMCPASQYADDTQALLPSLHETCVTRFLAAMDVYAQASGQHLNLSKCELLPVGMPVQLPATQGPAGPAVAGIKVVTQASALGLTFSNASNAAAAVAEADWNSSISTIRNSYSKIAKLRLSVFGRAFAASGYGISKLLYSAEFEGMPGSVQQALQTMTTKLVDRGLAPDVSKRALPGVPSALLPGHPSEGGFGCLPWRAHILSRHAVWGARLITGLAQGVSSHSPLWHQAAHALLVRSSGGRPGAAAQPIVPPALALIAAVQDVPGTIRAVAGQPSLPPGPLHRMVLGLRALHPGGLRPYDIGDKALTPGAWCAAMPLWGNPLLPARVSDDGGGPGSILDEAFGDLQVIPSLRTVGDAYRIALAVHDANAFCSAHQISGDAAHRFLMQRIWQPERLRCGLSRDVLGEMSVLVADRHRVNLRLAALCASLPPEWLSQCRVSQPSDVHAAAATIVPMIVSRLGWRLPVPHSAGPGVLGRPVPLVKLTVKAGTQLQLGPTAAARRTQHSAYVGLAMGLPHGTQPSPAAVRGLASTLSSAWRLKWENAEKEVLWRLSVNGIAGVNNRVAYKCPGCPGSDLGEGRAHTFWHCPVAAAVRSTITAALQSHSQTSGISRSSIWLCRPPKSVHSGVWQVVCMAAVSAMDHGRRQLWRLVKRAEEKRDAVVAAAAVTATRRGQHTLLQVWRTQPQPELAPLKALAARYAVADFWGRLASFAALGLAPNSWLTQVGIDHPFLGMGGKRVNMGAAAQAGGTGNAGGAGGTAHAAAHKNTGAQRNQALAAVWAAVGVKLPTSQPVARLVGSADRGASRRAHQRTLCELWKTSSVSLDLEDQSSVALT